MTIVSIHMPELTQGTLGDASGYTLKLSKSTDLSALNGSGDSLVWAGGKWLTANVAEPWSVLLAAEVLSAAGLAVRDGWLGSGETIVRDAYPSSGGGGGEGGLTSEQDTKLTEIHEAVFPPDPDDSPLVITPDDPGKVTGYAVCYGLDGEAAAGIVVTYKLQSPPARDVGRILNGSTTGTRTSAENGLITFPGLFPGSTYYFTCGSTTVSITIPLDADSETGYELPSFQKR